MWSLSEIIDDYNMHTKEHSEELKQINIEQYRDLISNDKQLDTYISGKSRIKILYSDLKDYKDECLVNAANELLMGGGGVDGFVHSLGGENLLNEIKQIPLNEFGCRLMEGEAFYTNGYNEQYEKIIHTVS